MLSVKCKPKALRAIRERSGHTLGSLAIAADVSKQRLWQLENDPEQKGIKPTTAKRIADGLGVDIEDIATITDDPEAVAS